MKYLVLDTNIIIRQPQLINIKLKDTVIVLPDAVLSEIEMAAGRRSEVAALPSLIRDAFVNHVIKIEGAPFEFAGKFSPSSHLDGDTRILRYLEYLKESRCDFLFVTRDKALQRVCATEGFPLMEASALNALIGGAEEADKELGQKLKWVRLKLWVYPFANIAVGVLSSLIASYAYDHVDKILAFLNAWGVTGLLLLLGIILYILRAWFRRVYGTLEFCFGLFLASKQFSHGFDYSNLSQSELLQILSGLYVMVRGLDNFQKGSKGTGLESLFERIAPSK